MINVSVVQEIEVVNAVGQMESYEVSIMANRLARRIGWEEQDNHDGGSSYHLSKDFSYPYHKDGKLAGFQSIGLWW